MKEGRKRDRMRERERDSERETQRERRKKQEGKRVANSGSPVHAGRGLVSQMLPTSSLDVLRSSQVPVTPNPTLSDECGRF